MLTDTDLEFLRRSIELAKQALATGNPPFGTLLVDAHGNVLTEEYNQITGGDRTHHPEFAVARWASMHLSASDRAHATVYTSGEHCPMCAAAHGWVGLGRIVYATSAKQLADWLAEWKIPRSGVRDLAIREVLIDPHVDGPAPELADAVHELHRQFFKAQR